MTRARSPRRDPQRGYALVAVLVLAGLMVMFASTYSKHVVVDARTDQASWAAVDVRERAASGVAFSRQALAADLPVPSLLQTEGSGSTSLAIIDLGDGMHGIEVQTTLADGTGAHKVAQASLLERSQSAPEGCDALPRLGADKVASLLDDPSFPKIAYVAGNTNLADTEIEGLLVVHSGAQLTLSDVVIKGAIVSEKTLSADTFGDFDSTMAPRVVMAGDVRIDSASWLPGLAICMPDGVIDTSAVSPCFQLEGDVVAHSVELAGPGAVHGHVASVTPAVLDPGCELVGIGRMEAEWADGMELNGSWTSEFLAFVPPSATLADVAAIVNYWSQQ